jgi:hypothetical protein
MGEQYTAASMQGILTIYIRQSYIEQKVARALNVHLYTRAELKLRAAGAAISNNPSI